MTRLNTASLPPLAGTDRHQVYCALDAAVTREINDALPANSVYRFEMALQAPILELSLRGFLVDPHFRDKAIADLERQKGEAYRRLTKLAAGVGMNEINPRSRTSLNELFHERMVLPPVVLSFKGVKRQSFNKEALETLEQYVYARPFVSLILTIRSLEKQLEVLQTGIDPDGRFRTSYNIGGTETGRLSSSESAWGTGGNAQNIAPKLRRMFIADPGSYIYHADAEQVEARDVGFFCGVTVGDWSYLDACESGDLHTQNAKRIWPELGWTGDPKQDRAIAEQPFYGGYKYRDMAKRGGHLCLTDDHEVLTPGGWVHITEKPSVIMCWNWHNKQQELYFANVLHWTDELYDGVLHHFKGNSVDLVATSQHRIPYRSDNRSDIRVSRAWQGPKPFMPLGDGYIGGNKEVPARLIAAFMSDGYQQSTNCAIFHLKKLRKIARLRYLCEMYGYPFYSTQNDRYVVDNWHGQFPKTAGTYMLNWTKECLSDFVDEYKYWDGHISETAVALFSKDKEHISWIKTIGRLLGIGGNISSFFVNGKEYYRLQQNNRKWASGKSVEWTEKLAVGRRVLCPTTPTGFLLARRNGKIFVTGNSNYMGTAFTASRHLKVPLSIMEEFQHRYITGENAAFPCIKRWWEWTIATVERKLQLTTPFGFTRQFFGRVTSAEVHREAIAFLPQSTTAHRTNLALWRAWRYLPYAQLLAQTHDSITFQAPTSIPTQQVIQQLKPLLVDIPFVYQGREYRVPWDVKVGQNWADYSDDNPNGLCKVA